MPSSPGSGIRGFRLEDSLLAFWVPFLAAEIPSIENAEVAADGTSVTWKQESSYGRRARESAHGRIRNTWFP